MAKTLISVSITMCGKTLKYFKTGLITVVGDRFGKTKGQLGTTGCVNIN